MNRKLNWTTAILDHLNISSVRSVLGPQPKDSDTKRPQPRLLVIDMTPIGSVSATGQIKSTLFGGWRRGKILQVAEISADLYLVRKNVFGRYRERIAEPERIRAAIDRFDPEIILYRPVADTHALPLHEFAMAEIARRDVPLVTWMMDDWPERLRLDDPDRFEFFDRDLRSLLDRSALRLSICDAMTEAFQERYEVPFQAFANAVDLEASPARCAHVSGTLLLRYGGALAKDMTARAVQSVARAVQELADSGKAIRFEINTQPHWIKTSGHLFEGLTATTLSTEQRSARDYAAWLQAADVLLIAYNRDPKSVRYVRYSMANKLPECLASGAALLVDGPLEVATVRYAVDHGVAEWTGDGDIADIRAALDRLANPDHRIELARKGRALVAERHELRQVREELRAALAQTLLQESPPMRARRNTSRRCPNASPGAPRSDVLDNPRASGTFAAQRMWAGSMKEYGRVVDLGEKAGFVLGNGPSLKGFDFSSLTPFSTFGMNAAYRYWDRIGWRPTHYSCLDLVVGMSHMESIRRLIREGREGGAPTGTKPIGQFLLRNNLIEALGSDGDDERVINFDEVRQRTPLLQVNPITTGSHVLLWARLLNCQPIILLGIDGNYKEIVEGAVKRDGIVLEITEAKSNPNYFFDDYQRPGDLYNLPNPRPDLHASAWWQAALDLEKTDGQVANGNPKSSVRVFPFVDVEELLSKQSADLTQAEPNPLRLQHEASEEVDLPRQPRTLANDTAAQESRSKKGKNAQARAGILLGPLAAALLGGVAAYAGALPLAILIAGLLSAASVTLLLYLLRFALAHRISKVASPQAQNLIAIRRELEDIRRQLSELNSLQVQMDETQRQVRNLLHKDEL